MTTWIKSCACLVLAATAAALPAAHASAATVSIETYKDNNVLADSLDEANPTTNPEGVLNAWDRGLAYLAFDLSSIPSGAAITAASVGATDLRTTRNQNIKIDFIDVPADWDESAFTYNMAMAGYGAQVDVDTGDSAVDPSLLLWEGNFFMDRSPPEEVLATTHAPSGTTDQDLLDGLNAELTSGDGQVVMALRGTVGVNNYVASRDDPDYAGPTLHLTYVPEPTTLLMAVVAAAGSLVMNRRFLGGR